MNNNTIITIGRMSGAGGKLVGEALAKKLGIKCYDKDLLTLAAKESGMSEDLFKKYDEHKKSGLLYTLFNSASYAIDTVSTEVPQDEKLYIAQFQTIKKLAEEGSCVIIGRCADYVLRDNPNVVSVFCTGSEDVCLKRLQENFGYSEKAAKEEMKKSNAGRSSYYNYYTGTTWGNWSDAATYDLCINTDNLSYEAAADLILKYIEVSGK